MVRPWLFSVATIYKSPINTLHVRHQLFWKPQTRICMCMHSLTHTQYIILVLITKTTTLWVSFSIFLHLFLNSTLRVWTFGNVQRFHYSAPASFDWSVCLHRQKKIFIDATIKLTPLFKAAIPGDLDTPTKHEAKRSLSTVQSVIVHLLNMCLILPFRERQVLITF